MNKTKFEKGITLIALIITIVVLLVIAVVTIGVVQESGIIGHAQNAQSSYTIEAEKEQIGLALSEWQIQKNIPGNPETLSSVLTSELSDVAQIGAVAEDGSITIRINKTQNKYKINEDSTIEGPLESAGGDIVTPPSGGSGENDDSTEEILWSYIDYGDDYYALRYIGNATELELIEDKDLKVYPGTFNEDSEEYEYDNTKTITMKLSEVEIVDIGPLVEKVTVGEVARNFTIDYHNNEITLVVLAEFGDIPESHFEEMNINSIVIQEGIESIGDRAFARNYITSLTLPASVTSIGQSAFVWKTSTDNRTIYYGGTQEQWNKISSAFSNDIEVIIGQE